MTTSLNTVPVLDAPAGLEDRVKATLQTQAAFKREATARAAIQTAMVTMAVAATNDLTRRSGQRKNRGSAKPRVAPPMAAIRIGRMAEVAWSTLSGFDQEFGLPLWKLASLANLHFIPVPARKLHELAGTTMVFELVKPALVDQLNPEQVELINPNFKPARRLGFAFISRALPGMGQALLGIKIFDHQGNVLVAAGQAPMGATEKVSPFTQGIFDGADELPVGWIYRTKAQQPSPEITAFISACLPRRREL